MSIPPLLLLAEAPELEAPPLEGGAALLETAPPDELDAICDEPMEPEELEAAGALLLPEPPWELEGCSPELASVVELAALPDEEDVLLLEGAGSTGAPVQPASAMAAPAAMSHRVVCMRGSANIAWGTRPL